MNYRKGKTIIPSQLIEKPKNAQFIMFEHDELHLSAYLYRTHNRESAHAMVDIINSKIDGFSSYIILGESKDIKPFPMVKALVPLSAAIALKSQKHNGNVYLGEVMGVLIIRSADVEDLVAEMLKNEPLRLTDSDGMSESTIRYLNVDNRDFVSHRIIADNSPYPEGISDDLKEALHQKRKDMQEFLVWMKR